MLILYKLPDDEYKWVDTYACDKAIQLTITNLVFIANGEPQHYAIEDIDMSKYSPSVSANLQLWTIHNHDKITL